MDIIPELRRINYDKKILKKLQLIRPPPTNESNDDFYLNRLINNNKNGNDESCKIF